MQAIHESVFVVSQLALPSEVDKQVESLFFIDLLREFLWDLLWSFFLSKV